MSLTLSTFMLDSLLDGLTDDVCNYLLESTGVNFFAAPSEFNFEKQLIQGLSAFTNAYLQEEQMRIGSELYQEIQTRRSIPQEALHKALDTKAIEAGEVVEGDAIIYMWVTVANPGAVAICPMCLTLAGQEYRQDMWVELGFIPGNGRTYCESSCRCQLIPSYAVQDRRKVTNPILRARNFADRAEASPTGLEMALPEQFQKLKRFEYDDLKSIMQNFFTRQADRSETEAETWRQQMRAVSEMNRYITSQ